MATNACGFKIGTRAATLVVKLSRALLATENATFATYLADIDSGTPTFLLAAKTVDGPDQATELRFKVQHNTEGPVIGFSQSGNARITLKFIDASAALSIDVVCHLEIAMSSSVTFKSPDQSLSLGDTVDWFVTT